MNLIAKLLPPGNVLLDLSVSSKKRLFEQVGLLAPAMLVALRLIQGFAVGGEWGGAVLIVAEHGDAGRRGFWTSWPQAGVAAGRDHRAAGPFFIRSRRRAEAKRPRGGSELCERRREPADLAKRGVIRMPPCWGHGGSVTRHEFSS